MSEDDPLAIRVRQVEELLSHQDRRYEQLNSVVVELRAEMDQMKATLRQRIDQLESRIDTASSMPDPDEKPPHY